MIVRTVHQLVAVAASTLPLLGAAAILATSACRESTAPVGRPGTVLVAGLRAPFVAATDPTGRLLARPGAVPAIQFSAAAPLDGSVLYGVGVDSIRAPSEWFAVDPRTLTVLWRERADSMWARGPSGLTASGFFGLGIAPDGRTIVATGHLNGKPAIVAVDVASRTALAGLAPFEVSPRGIATLPPGPTLPSGGIIVAGTREPTLSSERAQGMLLVLEPRTLAVLDSAIITTPASGDGGIRHVIASPDGRYVYLVGPDRLYRYDLVTRATIRAPYPTGVRAYGRLAISPDGGTLFLTDPGDVIDYPGSGYLYVLGPALESLGAIDLRGTVRDTDRPNTHAAAVSSDGARVYVTAGTDYIGPGYGTQHATLIIVDVAARRVERSVDFGVFGPNATVAVLR